MPAPAPTQIRELAELTVDELRRAAEGLSPAEIDRARAQMKAGLLMGLESPSARAERLARMVSDLGPRARISTRRSPRIDAVTRGAARLRRGAARPRADPAVALLGPVADAPDRAALARRLAA